MNERLPAGRSQWLAAHILPHESQLRGWLGRRAVAGVETDDIVQEAYAVLATLTDVSHVENPRAYLFRTAWSLVMKQLRRAQVVTIQSVADVADLQVPWDGPDPEQQIGARFELVRLARALDDLPVKCREVFRLRKVEGLSQREVAQRLGLSESTVEKHVARAVRLLAEQLTGVAEPGSPTHLLPGLRARRQH